MLKQISLWMLILGASSLFTGCAHKQIKPKPVCLAGTDVNSAMERIEKVLLRMNYFIVKADPTVGYMRTNALPGGQFFELWRKDNRDGYSWWESNLGSIQRTVELNFSNNNDLLCIDCNVTVERLSIPEKQIDSTARGYSMYTGSNDTTANLRLNKKQEKDMAWENLGEDNNFEKYILDKINKEFTKKKKKR